MIHFIFFDVAQTLLHKPDLYIRVADILNKNNHSVSQIQLQKNHKLLSEVIHFPDKTNKEFYWQFNAEWLYSLGIIPTHALLEEIFASCSYLPWSVFDDVAAINEIPLPKGIISNWDLSLRQNLQTYVPVEFDIVLGSAEYGFAKPHASLYHKAITLSGFAPDEILFVGDSLKLDIEPAQKCGMNAVLIDRHHLFPGFKNRICSMYDLSSFKELIL